MFTKKQKITPISLDDTSVTPLEKGNLKSADLEKGIHFFNGRCVVRAANRLELRQAAYELLHNIYSKMGFVKNKSGGLWLSIYDTLPETTTLIVEDNQGEIGAALTLVFDSPIGLPADELYKEEIDGFRNGGRKICEIISFGINKSVKGSVKILAGLFYSAYLLAWRINNATDLVITVHARYENFYRNLLFNKIGPVRKYAKVNGTPTVLLNLPLQLPDVLREKQRIFPLYLLNYSKRKEHEVANKIKSMLCPMSDEEFYTFFIEKTDTWEKASAEQKDYIKKVYPADQADHFSISRALARAVSKEHQDQNDNSE
jgi:hypothetical protein